MKLPLSHKLNKANIKKLIQRSDESVRHIVEHIFDVTQHISFEHFILLLNKNIEYFINRNLIKNNVMYVYLANISNEWLLEYLTEYLAKKHPYIFLHTLFTQASFTQITKDDSVFIIDDCSYSGQYASKSIVEVLKHIGNVKVNIVILISFMSDDAKDNTISVFKKSSSSMQSLMMPKYIHYIYPITDDITPNQLAKVYYFYDIFILKDISLYPVYFDHKLARTDATLTELYSGIVPNKHNKIIIERYNSKNDENILKDLEVYNVLRNCEDFVITDMDFDTRRCPSLSSVSKSARYTTGEFRRRKIDFYSDQKSSSLKFSSVDLKKVLKPSKSPSKIVNLKRASSEVENTSKSLRLQK